jgi:hypothetical protein
METRVVIRDTATEENFELTGNLPPRKVEKLRRVAEKVAQDTGWAVTIAAEKAR